MTVSKLARKLFLLSRYRKDSYIRPHRLIMKKLKYFTLLLWGICGGARAFAADGFSDPVLDSLRLLLHSEADDSTKVELNIKISRHKHRGNHGQQACIEHAVAAVDLAANMANTLLYAKALDNLGLLYRYHQYYAESLPLHKKAFDLIEHLPHAPALSKMIYANNTGVAARHNGDDVVAVKYYLRSLAIAKDVDDKKNMEIASSGIGIVLLSMGGREEEGLSYMHQALELATEAGNTLGQAMHYLSIGSYHDEQGAYEQARDYFRQLQELNEDMDDKHGLAITFRALGTSYLREGADLSTAERYFQRSKAYYEEEGHDIGLAYVLYQLGDIRYRNNKRAEALPYFQQALETGYKHANKSLIQENAERIAQIYEDQQDTKQALAYYKTAQVYKDSIARLEQETAVMAIKRKYDFENKENEIRLLTNEKLLKDAELERRVLIIYCMSGVVVLLLGLIFFLVRIRRLRKRALGIIARQREDKVRAEYEKSLMEAEMIATRMQVNPHFMFNSLGAIRYMIQKNDNEEAMRYLVTFSRFIRRVLETSEQPIHTVGAELSLLEDFLKLEAIRFDEDFEYYVDDGVHRWAEHKVMPAMLLQPFVENAIWHGLLPSQKSHKRLMIEAISTDSGITISIEDNGVGFVNHKPEPRGHTSMGHRITNKRIELYNKSFGGHIDWHIKGLTDAEGNLAGTRVQVTIGIDRDSDTTAASDPLRSIRTKPPVGNEVELSRMLSNGLAANPH